MTRTCIHCGYEGPSTEFYEGQGNSCKKCTKAASKTWRALNPVAHRITRRTWEKDNTKLAVKRRSHRLQRRYNLKQAQVEAMLAAQDYQCAICQAKLNSPFQEVAPPNTTRCVVDHDHRDGHIRGLLCAACNNGLGQFEDKIENLKGAYYYLKNDVEAQRAAKAQRPKLNDLDLFD